MPESQGMSNANLAQLFYSRFNINDNNRRKWTTFTKHVVKEFDKPIIKSPTSKLNRSVYAFRVRFVIIKNHYPKIFQVKFTFFHKITYLKYRANKISRLGTKCQLNYRSGRSNFTKLRKLFLQPKYLDSPNQILIHSIYLLVIKSSHMFKATFLKVSYNRCLHLTHYAIYYKIFAIRHQHLPLILTDKFSFYCLHYICNKTE